MLGGADGCHDVRLVTSDPVSCYLITPDIWSAECQQTTGDNLPIAETNL